jgi:hypothetical protein
LKRKEHSSKISETTIRSVSRQAKIAICSFLKARVCGSQFKRMGATMKNELTDISEIVGLASRLVALFVATTETISKKLVGLEEDNVIKALANVLKAQAAAMESELAVLRRELAKTQSKVNKKSQSEAGAQLRDERTGGESLISGLKAFV